MVQVRSTWSVEDIVRLLEEIREMAFGFGSSGGRWVNLGDFPTAWKAICFNGTEDTDDSWSTTCVAQEPHIYGGMEVKVIVAIAI